MASADEDYDPGTTPESEEFQRSSDLAKDLLKTVDRLKGPDGHRMEEMNEVLSALRTRMEKKSGKGAAKGLTKKMMTDMAAKLGNKKNTIDGKSAGSRFWTLFRKTT